MKKALFTFIITLGCLMVQAQEQQIQLHESFKQDEKLRVAFMQFDMSSFMSEKATFVLDTLTQVVDKEQMGKMMKRYIHMPKNSQVRKASESNNGYTQTYGIYKGDDAISYVRFTLSQIDGTLEEVVVEHNN